LLQQAICLGDVPPPDLCIRTGGERRISNFLLWQMAYTELYFTDCYWPEFKDGELQKALDDFSHRTRRYGRHSESDEQSLPYHTGSANETASDAESTLLQCVGSERGR